MLANELTIISSDSIDTSLAAISANSKIQL